ncbi:MAG: hypothetical protein Aurels2KO_58070 [Aureliella sp.]
MNIESINDENRNEASSALCRTADLMTKLLIALFQFTDGKHDVNKAGVIAAVLKDPEIEKSIAMSEQIVRHWKDYLEIREHPSHPIDTYLFAHCFCAQRGIDKEIHFAEIAGLHELVLAEQEGGYDDSQEIEIRTKVIARWLGIDES